MVSSNVSIHPYTFGPHRRTEKRKTQIWSRGRYGAQSYARKHH